MGVKSLMRSRCCQSQRVLKCRRMSGSKGNILIEDSKSLDLICTKYNTKYDQKRDDVPPVTIEEVNATSRSPIGFAVYTCTGK